MKRRWNTTKNIEQQKCEPELVVFLSISIRSQFVNEQQQSKCRHKYIGATHFSGCEVRKKTTTEIKFKLWKPLLYVNIGFGSICFKSLPLFVILFLFVFLSVFRPALNLAVIVAQCCFCWFFFGWCCLRRHRHRRQHQLIYTAVTSLR